MQQNLNKNIEKIFSEFGKINGLAKSIVKYGSIAFLLLFAAGTIFLLINHFQQNFDSYFDFTAKALIKNSFIILAEAVIGGLLMDYILKKN
ncbi:MAG: hypothetical protein QHH06_02350 [Clostridiales bacterium]|jgi:hypothetical protein|nr:hypothetical protein [Eubacteriales bacterium]MDH7565311.1 hypothetical protein [Clostridiales bacterium]